MKLVCACAVFAPVAPCSHTAVQTNKLRWAAVGCCEPFWVVYQPYLSAQPRILCPPTALCSPCAS